MLSIVHPDELAGDDDLLDHGDIDFSEGVVHDDDLDWVVLFPEKQRKNAVDRAAERWGMLAGASPKTARSPRKTGQGRQLWIADMCRSYGLTVVEVAGWQTRGSAVFNPDVTVCHHTAGSPTGELPSLRILINGHSALPGPLCNVALSRSGVVYVVAAGRANHAGSGSYRGRVGNSSCMGIEAENDGFQPWPQAQLDAYFLLCAALQDGMNSSSDLVTLHKVWAGPRKPDPHTLTLAQFHFATGIHMYVHKVPNSPFTPEEIEDMPKPKDVNPPVNNPTGPGYWLVEADGGVQAKDGAPFFGSWFNVPAKDRVLADDEHFVGLALIKDEKTGKVIDYHLVTNKGDHYNPQAA